MRKIAVTVVLFAAVSAFAATPKTVDSGSFGVFVGGKRVATEKFDIQQRGDVNVATSELRAEDAGNTSTQSSELQLAANGDILKYTWRDHGTGKAQAVVEPAHEFLVEHVSAGDGKPQDTPFLLPHSTIILDDYSFAQRQILAWKYLASVCKADAGRMGCSGERAQFGVLIPQQQSAASVYLTLKGKEKVSIRGAERELNRINLEVDGTEWAMWLDDSNKIIRIFVASANTEVLRD